LVDTDFVPRLFVKPNGMFHIFAYFRRRSCALSQKSLQEQAENEAKKAVMCSRLTLALRKQKEKENLDDIAQKLKDYMKVTECLPVEEEVEVITPLPELTDQMQVGKI